MFRLDSAFLLIFCPHRTKYNFFSQPAVFNNSFLVNNLHNSYTEYSSDSPPMRILFPQFFSRRANFPLYSYVDVE